MKLLVSGGNRWKPQPSDPAASFRCIPDHLPSSADHGWLDPNSGVFPRGLTWCLQVSDSRCSSAGDPWNHTPTRLPLLSVLTRLGTLHTCIETTVASTGSRAKYPLNRE